MENQEAPASTEPRTAEQDLFQLLNEFATAYQIDKQHQEAVDQRAHQLRVMTEQNRHDEAIRWIANTDSQRKEHLDFLRHQFDRQYWLSAGVAIAALAFIAGLIFIKNNITAAHVVFSLVVTFLAGRRSKELFSAPGASPIKPVEPPPPIPPIQKP